MMLRHALGLAGVLLCTPLLMSSQFVAMPDALKFIGAFGLGAFCGHVADAVFEYFGWSDDS